MVTTGRIRSRPGDCMYAISRVKSDKPGWQLFFRGNYRLKGRRKRKSFSDFRYDDDCEKSLLAAITYRDKHLSEVYHQRGLRIALINRVYRANDYEGWYVTWTDLKDKPRTNSFSDHRYGSSYNSFAAAILFRIKVEILRYGETMLDFNKELEKYELLIQNLQGK